MRLHLYEIPTDEIEMESFWNDIFIQVTDGFFRAIEWMLLLGTLTFVFLKTDDLFFAAIAVIVALMVFVRLHIHMFWNFDLFFWPPPLRGWRANVMLGVRLVIGVAGPLMIAGAGAYGAYVVASATN